MSVREPEGALPAYCVMKQGRITDLQCRHVPHNHGAPEQHVLEAARERHTASYALVYIQRPFEGSE